MMTYSISNDATLKEKDIAILVTLDKSLKKPKSWDQNKEDGTWWITYDTEEGKKAMVDYLSDDALRFELGIKEIR
jgi:hypothetical protein